MTVPTLTTAQLATLLADPRDVGLQGIVADYLEEAGNDADATLLRRGFLPVRLVERQVASTLDYCRFPPGGPVKRYVRNVVAAVARGQKDTLTVPQLAYLWSLVRHFRRQIEQHFPRNGTALVDLAFALGGKAAPVRPVAKAEPLWEEDR